MMLSIREQLAKLNLTRQPTAFELELQAMIDSPAKIAAPKPLPYISRRRLERVEDAVAPPTQCPHCNSEVSLVNHKAVYRGREYGDWPFVYACFSCPGYSYVGLHPGTHLPLGTLANRAMRDARKQNKDKFNRLIQLTDDRTHAYDLLAQEMGISRSECHWAMFSVEQAHAAGDAAQRIISRLKSTQ